MVYAGFFKKATGFDPYAYQSWLGEDEDECCDLNGAAATGELFRAARQQAASAGVPLDGWTGEAKTLTPKGNLRKAILATWPVLDD